MFTYFYYFVHAILCNMLFQNYVVNANLNFIIYCTRLLNILFLQLFKIIKHDIGSICKKKLYVGTLGEIDKKLRI